MDGWVTVTRSSTEGRSKDEAKDVKRTTTRHHPYARSNLTEASESGTGKEQWKPVDVVKSLSKNGNSLSKAALTKHLLATLSDTSNPITHSDIYSRTTHYTSAASGHQRGEGRGADGSSWMRERSGKLREQLPQVRSGILRGVRVWIDGYLADTTDIEMKRIVKLAGGEVLCRASGATHILTSQQLNGSKTHKLLTTKARVKPHIVRPEWVFESVEAGKRLSEGNYTMVQDTSASTLEKMFGNPHPKHG